MKITIDTKEDSKEEIAKIITMLQSLVGNKEVFSNKDIFSDNKEKLENDSETEPNAFVNMFSDDTPAVTETEEKKTEEVSQDEEEKDTGQEEPKIIFEY